MKMRLPGSFHNPISYSGAAIALIAMFMFVFLYVIASLSSIDRAYVGIVLFIVIPAFIILGLALIPLGMWRRHIREQKQGSSPDKNFPILDLNLPQHRSGFFIFAIGTVLFLFLSALGSYEAFHFTESVTFCGELCHTVMAPEYTAYQVSPHARVTCVECHVGAGANWYVKSKLSGLYQVYAAIMNKYPRPIPTPVENLRPARETCEECHWPQKVYGKQQRREIYYLADDNNTRWEIDLLMNTGGGNPALGQKSGIHWHINSNIKIEYVAVDNKRLDIPRVTLTDLTTSKTITYNSTMSAASDSALQAGPTRVMDCIDCHNRPSHIYRDPNRFINTALASGDMDPAIPGIKRAAVEACMAEYDTPETAMQEIDAKLRATLSADEASLTRSIQGAQKAFSLNVFPAMKVRWSEYPDHIGHMTTPGCFRCHDDQHVSEDGRVISKACDLCHAITAQGPSGQMEYAGTQPSLDFKHPEEIGDAWKETGCSDCHSTPPI